MQATDWVRIQTKHSFGISRNSKRVADVFAGAGLSYTPTSSHMRILPPAYLPDESAVTGKELPELKRSDLLMVKKWVESLGQQLMSRSQVHPMIQYFEGVVHDYDSDEVAEGLREFLERYHQAKP